MLFPFPIMTFSFTQANTLPDPRGKFIYTKYWLCSYFPGHPEGEHVIRYREQVFLFPETTFDKIEGDKIIHKNVLTPIL